MPITGNTDPDDGWADLARELGLEQPPRPPAVPTEADANGESDPLFPPADGRQDLFHEYEQDGDTEADGGDADDADADGEPTGEPGEEGPKKKRRRRRRRKKKGGEAGDVGTAAGGEADDEGDDTGEADDAAHGDEEDETEEDEPAAHAPVDDGGPTAEASRELIANWDVPSWEQIVAGLYRPGGR